MKHATTLGLLMVLAVLGAAVSSASAHDSGTRDESHGNGNVGASGSGSASGTSSGSASGTSSGSASGSSSSGSASGTSSGKSGSGGW